RSVGIGRLIGAPSMIGEGTLAAALSKPFLLKIIFIRPQECDGRSATAENAAAWATGRRWICFLAGSRSIRQSVQNGQFLCRPARRDADDVMFVAVLHCNGAGFHRNHERVTRC